MRPSCLPEETDYPGIIRMVQSDAKALNITDFITRSKLDTKLNPSCKLKAEGNLGEKKNNSLALGAAIAKCKKEFGQSARVYVVILFGAAQGFRRFTSHIVRGLRVFDLDLLLVDPLTQESICTEEYLFFLDELRC